LSEPAPDSPCDDCEAKRIEKEADAAEAEKAWTRKRQELAIQHANEIAKADRQHQIALEQADETLDAELLKSHWQAERDLNKHFHETVAEVSKGAIDRSRDSAKYVQTGAGAIMTLYTGLLALVFSVTDNPLPSRGVWVAVFLGLAIALATAYLAFLNKPKAPPLHRPSGPIPELQLLRTGYLTKLINATVYNRRWAIQASVVSLAVGVAFLPAAFVTNSRQADIPDPPAAPAIPAEVAESIAPRAGALFDAQVQGYEEAVQERNEAIQKASQQAAESGEKDADLNRTFALLALVGGIVVLFMPSALAVYTWRRSRGDGNARNTGQGLRGRPGSSWSRCTSPPLADQRHTRLGESPLASSERGKRRGPSRDGSCSDTSGSSA